MRILFVGDTPSKNNIYKDIAFIGTPSHKNLLKWIEELGCGDNYIMRNSNSHGLLMQIHDFYVYGSYTVIALGEKASKRLKEYRVPHFKLPHPSPKNRKLNDKQFLKDSLKYLKQILTREVI